MKKEEIKEAVISELLRQLCERFTRYKRFVSLVVKLLRAHDECLGVDRLRRTWQAAKSFGESHTDFDPEISEWGNPAPVMRCHQSLNT